MLDSFESFAYVSSYLDVKSFAEISDCTISSKTQWPRSSPGLLWKALIEFCKLHLNERG